ncbi:MAG: alpha/beta hydrolase [candidate division NC10 bacterium]|nr:alpha/beta hydrolase [candidate division NC10 bacterium]MDE2484638.1 alpha/beta hydrolase [candidate division NC10 bacterium]
MLIRVGDLDTHFSVWGEGRPVVLLHGWGTSAESLSAVAKALEDRFRVYALDLPGFGWTPAAAATWGTWEYASYVEAFMDCVGIPMASLIGHSFGGRIALALAARWPERVRNLVLVASAGIRPRRGLLYYVKVGAVKLAKRLFSLPLWGRLGERVVGELYGRIGSRDYRNAGPMRATLVKVVGEDLRGILASVRVPTLIIWGDRDQEVPFSAMEIMARGIQGSRLEVLEGAGHFPFVDSPDRFGRLVREFLCQDSR